MRALASWTAAVLTGVAGVAPATLISIPLAAEHLIVGVDQNAGTSYAGVGYYSNAVAGLDIVGASGASGSREHYNQVKAFALPTLGLGETIGSAALIYTVTAMRDDTTDNDVTLRSYVLNTTTPVGTGTAFFEQDDTPAADVYAVGTYFYNPSGTAEVDINPDAVVTNALAGDALTYLQGLYSGPSPTQPRVWFRLNIDSNQGVALDRYRVQTGTATLELTVVPEPASATMLLLGATVAAAVRRRRP
jgi:hypothetical protein